MGNVALVFAGGDRPPPRALVGLPPPHAVIAADSGLDHATALGFAVDVIVGDLDSADPAAVDAAVATGTVVERHPEAKDATDLELALLAARTRGCERVVVIGGHGGRLDHFLANALLLASPEFADLQVEARLGDAQVFVVRRDQRLHAAVGDLCTLLPVGGRASGVRTEGLRFPLCRETLEPGSTRGVSNEFLVPVARVSLDDGVLLAIVVGTDHDHETANR
jgi:thiamine pyrophosphokinase